MCPDTFIEKNITGKNLQAPHSTTELPKTQNDGQGIDYRDVRIIEIIIWSLVVCGYLLHTNGCCDKRSVLNGPSQSAIGSDTGN